MALSTTVPDLESIPEAFREHYSPIDEKDLKAGYTLVTDNSQEKGSIREYRNTHKSLSERAEAAETQLKAFGNQDPKTLARAMEALKQVEDSAEQKLILDGKFEEVMSNRTEAMRTTFTGQIEAQTAAYNELQTSNASLKDQLAQVRVGELVSKGIEKAGVKVRPGAMQYILQQTRETFSLNDEGQPVVKAGPKYGKEGTPKTIPEHIESMVSNSPFLFEGSKGGGANGGSSGGVRTLTVEGNSPTAFAEAGIEAIAAGKIKVL